MNKTRHNCAHHSWRFDRRDWSQRGIIAYYAVAVYRCVHCGRKRRIWGKYPWEIEVFEKRHPIVPGGSASRANKTKA